MLEDALPIAVGSGQTKSASEVFRLKHKDLRNRVELTKEERSAERSKIKRKVKATQHQKAIERKEKLRQQGLQLAERFVVKEAKRHMEKIKNKNKKASQKGQVEGEGRRTNSSAKVFSNL